MRRWWGELVIDFKDRMDGLVAAAHKGRLDDDEHELAVQLAMIRFARKLVDSFEGVSMGQLVNATRTLANFACIDVQKDAIKARARTDASFDDGWRAEDIDGAPSTGWEADVSKRALEDAERAQDAADFVAWALPQVQESRRRVLELTLQGAELEEICTELGISDANAYQRRSRGLKDLKKLKETYDA